MDKTRKLEAAWWWARNARLEALRQKREEYGDPRNPLRALPGHEAEFEAATELSQSMDVILKALELTESNLWIKTFLKYSTPRLCVTEPETLEQDYMAHYQTMQKRKKKTA